MWDKKQIITLKYQTMRRTVNFSMSGCERYLPRRTGVLSFGDPLFGHTFSPLTLYTVSVIGFLASEYSLAI